MLYEHQHEFNVEAREMYEKKLSPVRPDVVQYQGDAHDIMRITKKDRYDLILNCNLIDRLSDPRKFLLQ